MTKGRDGKRGVPSAVDNFFVEYFLLVVDIPVSNPSNVTNIKKRIGRDQSLPMSKVSKLTMSFHKERNTVDKTNNKPHPSFVSDRESK